MRKRKLLVVSLIIAAIGLMILSGTDSEYLLSPIGSNAQTQSDPFAEINQLAKENNLSPTLKRSKNITLKVIDALSVLDIPQFTKDAVVNQVAAAHLNGTSQIDENNIAGAVNNLANQAVAPTYAYTNAEQVKVVRKFLNRLMPNLVSANGYMSDIESIAVFTAVLSQKFDNEAFMVSPAEFTASLSGSSNQPFPGTSSANTTTLQSTLITPKMIEMDNVLGNYVNSQNMVSPNDIISMIGIH